MKQLNESVKHILAHFLDQFYGTVQIRLYHSILQISNILWLYYCSTLPNALNELIRRSTTSALCVVPTLSFCL